MTKFAVLIPYFNPVGYRSHPLKMARCLESFDQAGLGADTFLVGAGKDHPVDGQVVFWDERCDFLWHKERLLNLGARHLPPEYTHVVWADNDVMVDPSWPRLVAEAFERAPIVQCFREAKYQRIDGLGTSPKVSWLVEGEEGNPGVMWGAERSLFSDGPGMYERALVGSGDLVFAAASLRGRMAPSAPWSPFFRPSLEGAWSQALLDCHDDWVKRFEDWLGSASPVAVDALVTVLEHGTKDSRDYVRRQYLLQQCVPDEHLVAGENQTFRWSESGAALIEPGIRDYFLRRAEDHDLDDS